MKISRAFLLKTLNSNFSLNSKKSSYSTNTKNFAKEQIQYNICFSIHGTVSNQYTNYSKCPTVIPENAEFEN